MLPGIAGILAGTSRQKVVSYLDLKTATNSASSYTLSAASIGTADAQRVVIVGISYVNGDTETISAVTIGGVSASILVQSNSALEAVGAGIAAAIVPTGTTADVVVTLTGNVTGIGVGVWATYDLDAASAVATGSNTDLSGLAVNAQPFGFVIAVTSNDSSRTMTWSGATEDYDQAFDGVYYCSGASGPTTGSSVTVTPTASGSADAVLVAASF